MHNSAGKQYLTVPMGATFIDVVSSLTLTRGPAMNMTINGTSHTFSGFDSVMQIPYALIEYDDPFTNDETRELFLINTVPGEVPEHCTFIGSYGGVFGEAPTFVYLLDQNAPCMWCGEIFPETALTEHEAACR